MTIRMTMLRTARRVRRAARTRLFSVDSSVLPSSMQSVRVNVGGNLELHAIVAKTKPTASAGVAPVLCLPSAFGSVVHNFRPQVATLGHEFEFVGVDPRGYGDSRPPARDFPTNYFERDADDVLRAMDALGYEKFSILGWSAGANTGAVFAAMHPDRVERLVLLNANAFVDADDVDIYTEYEDVNKWHPASRQEATSIYGAEPLQQGWSAMLAKLRDVYEHEHGDLFCDKLPQIRCKTLVVVGAKDRLVPEYHSEYLSERIMHAKRHVFPDGRHDVHLQHADEFNALLRTFLTEPDDKHTQSREFVARPQS